mmetsp:Transcript_1678/g.3586  ORF Transcript_1678/g.3586 Transcript_1678/m.3586 type:complete len:203 (-) Transcript_1678:137-745(-)
MRRWAFPTRAQSSVNNNDDSNDGNIEINNRRRSSTTVAGVTLVEDDDGTNLAIIYNDVLLDQLEDGFFGFDVRRSLGAFHVDAEVETVASTCTDLSCPSHEGDDEEGTPVGGESANHNAVSNRRSENTETYAIDPETGMSLPVATPMGINNEGAGGDDGCCKKILGSFGVSGILAAFFCLVFVISSVCIAILINWFYYSDKW